MLFELTPVILQFIVQTVSFNFVELISNLTLNDET